MFENERFVNPSIRQTVAEMYDECRANIDAYDSPSGIEVDVDNTKWLVTYWPESPVNDERLSLSRDWEKFENPANYQVLLTGNVVKNDKTKQRGSGGVFYDPEGEKLVHDASEVFVLQAVVRAAHELRAKEK